MGIIINFSETISACANLREHSRTQTLVLRNSGEEEARLSPLTFSSEEPGGLSEELPGGPLISH